MLCPPLCGQVVKQGAVVFCGLPEELVITGSETVPELLTVTVQLVMQRWQHTVTNASTQVTCVGACTVPLVFPLYYFIHFDSHSPLLNDFCS